MILSSSSSHQYVGWHLSRPIFQRFLFPPHCSLYGVVRCKSGQKRTCDRSARRPCAQGVHIPTPRYDLLLFGALYLVLTSPAGLDLTYRGVAAAIRHKNLEFWEWLFTSFGTAASPYTVEAQVGPQRFIFTAEPENIKAILATQFEDYGKGQPFHEDWKDFLGDSIFTTDGEQWHASRALIRPQFIKDRVSDLAIFEEHVQVLLGLMGGRGQEIDVSALFFRCVFSRDTLQRQEW